MNTPSSQLQKGVLAIGRALLLSAVLLPPAASGAPPFPTSQRGFEEALSLPPPVLQTKSMAMASKGYECVTSDPPRAAILFDFDSTALRGEFHPILAALAEALQNRLADAAFTLEGHTDSTGPEAYNMALSLRRAQAVRGYLLQAGIAPARLSVTGLGEQHPIADNATPEGQRHNRRVEVVRVSGVCGD